VLPTKRPADNNVHNTVVINNVTNTVTIMNPNGQTQTCRLRSRWRLRPARRRRI